MAGTKQVKVTPEAAERLGAPIAEAERKSDEYRELLRHSNNLEYALVRTRDALRVIARSLEDFEEEHASTAERMREGLTEDDVSLLCGAVNLLDYVAADCDRAFRAEA